MSNIKELTIEHHRNAERCQFVKILLSGNIHPDLYATYLFNQYMKYKELESLATTYDLLKNLPNIERTKKIYADFLELWSPQSTPEIFESTKEYVQHIRSIRNKQMLFAHIYVHHMGDLSGGQMIAKRVPGQGRMYHFQSNTQELKDAIRSRTTDEMAEEAGICFQYAIKLFDDLYNSTTIHYKIA
jgi:heme oxygenase